MVLAHSAAAALLLAGNVAPRVLTEAHVREVLRHDGPQAALAVVFIALGLGALALFLFRSRVRDALVAWFGVFALLFGVRLLIAQDSVQFAAGAPRSRAWLFVIAAISYGLSIPGALVLREALPAWRSLLNRAAWGACAFAAVAIACDLVLGRPFAVMAVNNVLVLASFLALAAALMRSRGGAVSLGALRTGAIVFAGAVIARNLVGLGAFQLPLDPEPFGFAVFLCCLGVFTAERVTRGELELAALGREIELARKIQQSLLPREVPSAPGLSIAARYIPMTAVAGDLYDFMRPRPGCVGILVADVSGHGIPAALIASMVKVAYAAETAHAADPGQVLTGMNRMLCGKFKGQFVTAACLFLDLDSGVLRFSGAGHPPMLRWRAGEDGGASAVTQNGLALGLSAPAKYASIELPIAPGDRFLLYTDGLLEARGASGADEQFGEARVRNVLARECSGASVEQTASALVDALARWAGYASGNPREDDLTLVVAGIADGAAEQPRETGRATPA